MNSLVTLTQYPLAAILLQWTVLLGLCWLAHFALRKRHARWRVILWRSALCFALVLPLAQIFPVPAIEVPVERGAAPGGTGGEGFQPDQTGTASITETASQVRREPSEVSSTAAPTWVPETRAPFESPSWKTLLFVLWAVGFAVAAIRLIRLHAQLSRIKKCAVPTGPAIREAARRLETEMGVRRTVEIRVSESVASPFVCGVASPTILLPRKLLDDLSSKQISALLAHEFAHVRQRDVPWCVAWRWMQAVCWFHPLVWKIPSVHNLACEQEADRIAASRLDDHHSYAQALAQLTLRLVSPPTVETGLTVNGTSQIVRRLNHLGRQGLGVWKRRHTVAALGLMGLFLLVTAGFQFSSASEPESDAEPLLERVRVVVEDEEGNPIEGATIEPTHLRVQGLLRGNHYFWLPDVHGTPVTMTTNRAGVAFVAYPVETDPDESLLTGEITVNVAHPDFGPNQVELPVDGTAEPIRLERAARVEVSAYFGEDRQPVTEIVPNLGGNYPPDPWTVDENGRIEFTSLAPGGRLLQLSGRLPSGEIVHSEPFAFTTESGEHYRFELEMKPGVRLEGRIDDNVSRPVTNGRVIVSVRPEPYDLSLSSRELSNMRRDFGFFAFWTSYREIEPDGTFVFESLPPGEVDVIAYGDGFTSDSEPDSFPGIATPQAFPLSSPVTSIEVVTEPTATLRVTTTTRDKSPVEGATVKVWPNVDRIGSTGSSIFGNLGSHIEESFRTLPSLPELPYSVVTNKNGVATLPNLPRFTSSLAIEHPDLEAPVDAENRTRFVRFELAPGETTEVEVTLQPKGTDSLAELESQ